MNYAKMSLLASGVGTLFVAASAQAGYTGMHAESDGGNAYGTTWRIYADMDAGSRLDAVYGNSTHVLSIDGSFYQNSYGGNTQASINPAFVAVFPSLAFDSWVTVGDVYWTDNAVATIGIDFTGFAAGGGITTSNGAWYVTPDDSQGDEAGGSVLIGQFTTLDGSMPTGQVSLQGSSADGSTWVAEGVWVPAPGALALLGLAGLAGTRRRRT